MRTRNERERLELELLYELENRQRVEDRWLRGDLGYKLHAGQLEIKRHIEENGSDEVLLLIARQWGKSFFSVTDCSEFCIKNPGAITRIAAPNLNQADDIVSDNIAPIFEDAPEGLIQKHRSKKRWRIGASELRLGMTKKSHSNTLRGGNAKRVYLEEGGFVKSDEYKYAHRSIIGPQLMRSMGKCIHITSVSEDPGHYIHTEILPSCKLSGSLYMRDIYHNPQLTLDHINRLARRMGGIGSEEFRRECLNIIEKSPTLVCVPEYVDELHSIDFEFPEHATWLTTVDWGGSRDKTVALLMYYDFEMGARRVWDERVFNRNTPTKVIIPEIRKMEEEIAERDPRAYLNLRRFVDAQAQHLIDLRNDYNYDASLPNKDDKFAGVNKVRTCIGRSLFVHKRCEFLRVTLDNGIWNKNRTDFERTDALGHMDAIAALAYGNRMLDTHTNPAPPTKLFKEEAMQRPNANPWAKNAILGAFG